MTLLWHLSKEVRYHLFHKLIKPHLTVEAKQISTGTSYINIENFSLLGHWKNFLAVQLKNVLLIVGWFSHLFFST